MTDNRPEVNGVKVNEYRMNGIVGIFMLSVSIWSPHAPHPSHGLVTTLLAFWGGILFGFFIIGRKGQS